MQPATRPAKVSESERLYAAWRCARARWELARYDLANLGRDLCKEADDQFCEADGECLMAYMLHPADDLRELARKLRIFREEDGSSWTRFDEVLEALENDAFDFDNLALSGVRR